MKYLNRTTKDVITKFAALQGMAEVIAESDWDAVQPVKDDVLAIIAHAENVLNHLESGIDKDQLQAVIRYANSCTIEVVPKTSPRSLKDYTLIENALLEEILSEVIGSCAFCDKNTADVKKCQLRRNLLKAGIVANDRGDCPYKG